MRRIVQKYGGSSLADVGKILDVAKRVGQAHDQEDQVVVVVSAMGDMTDELMGMAQQISRTPDLRELDVLISTGELKSGALMAIALRSLGFDAISLSGSQAGIHTDTGFGKARIASLDPKRVLGELAAGRIVVVAGFQGVTKEMDTTTLGRGASDLTAVALAASLGASQCEIYTDVDGIYTADPKLVSQARRLGEVGFEEMLEMASYGAKMNPRAIEFGMVYDVPILVASSTGSIPGTLINKGGDMNLNIGEIRDRVRAIATDTNVAKITVFGIKEQPGIASSLFRPLAEANISVDVIVQNVSVGGATDLTFTVKREDLPSAVSVVELVSSELEAKGVSSSDQLAKVSIIGTGMQDAPGYASRMFGALAESGINIEMITTSEIRITCIISATDVGLAASVLHEVFELQNDK